MLKSKLGIIFIVFLVATPLSLWAAGGGGGGGSGSVPPPSSCESDTWDCDAWGSCSANGEETRTCSLTFDCPTANNPRPEGTRACVPESAPAPATPSVSPGAPPATPSAPAPSCTKDEYQCNGWGQCGEPGARSRDCTLKRGCPGVNTPKPATSQTCPGLRCGQLPTLAERVSCRLGLTDEELSAEFKILFIPEACKVFADDREEKNECVRMYQNFGPCWRTPAGPARNACARKSLELGNVAGEKTKCLLLPQAEEKECLEDLKEKVKYMTVFRMYDLENRAEAMLDQGDYMKFVEKFDMFVEGKKRELYKSESITEWKKILLEVREEWKNFIKDIKAKK